jgi:hypothetical protein
MVVKTTKLTAENQPQYIIDKLTNELSVYKTTLVDINKRKEKSDEILGRKQLCRIYVEEHTRFAGRRSGNASLNHNKTMGS